MNYVFMFLIVVLGNLATIVLQYFLKKKARKKAVEIINEEEFKDFMSNNDFFNSIFGK